MSNLNSLNIIKLIIRLLLGVFFISTAVLKLLSIDSFEVYIYSFGIVNYITVTFLSRLLISIELLIGISLIFKIYFRQVWWLTMLIIAGFTLFLIYAAIFRNDSNCHCFGSLIELDPSQSIIKNIITIVLLLFIRKEQSHDYKPLMRKWLIGISIAVSIIIPFVLVPMDVIYNKIHSEKENINTVAFYESLSDSTYRELQQGRYLINYALAGCKFCRIGAEKLVLMVEKHNIPHEKIKFVVGGNDDAISKFIEKTNTSDYEHYKIPAPELMSITFGKFPLYVFLEDGKVVKAGDFRILDDGFLMEFF
ncbi:MAG: DoxX family membrane protein [Bacteroidales bacterium]|nr:DoxX family membrane protein [Bacteroidales bacterium]